MQVVNLPNPHEVVGAIMPLVGAAVVIVLGGLVALGPVGRAIGRVILHRLGGERERTLPAAEVRDLRGLLEEQGGRLESVQRQVAERPNGRTSPSGCWRRCAPGRVSLAPRTPPGETLMAVCRWRAAVLKEWL